ncbi:uncharacterized protein LOC111241707 isoform X2 [Vigna radiata var. radiata]|uniref:Uncharacterized protein LOC111241707 isoform X2 n=1 Tax=Vigna radiata var. radiata TaxID=3916 RepID=A0A3Q0F0Y4_VIGRR|nr:uncharacterized protein LOC111241707 isoform X2 [Vigna radiata var. radiata]
MRKSVHGGFGSLKKLSMGVLHGLAVNNPVLKPMGLFHGGIEVRIQFLIRQFILDTTKEFSGDVSKTVRKYLKSKIEGHPCGQGQRIGLISWKLKPSIAETICCI